jgi:hypothetical protein
VSSHRAWPPPYLYGLPWMRLAAAMRSLTAWGAEAGAMALPSGPIVASSAAVADGASWVCIPWRTSERSPRASPRDTRALTRRSDRCSHDRTLRAVRGPNCPSAVVGTPTRVR